MGAHGAYTCVDLDYALPQLPIVSFSINNYDLQTFNNIQDGMSFTIDWIRSYKLIDAKDSLYWPNYISSLEAKNTTVHGEIRLGGNEYHNGVIPQSENLTFWSKSSISLGSSFTVQPGTNVTFRCISVADKLFLNQ